MSKLSTAEMWGVYSLLLYTVYVKEDLAVNNPQWMICHKTKPNQTKPNHIYLIYMDEKDLALNDQQWWYAIKSNQTNLFAQSAGAVEYTDCFSAEG